jgi:preprotein translocase subunit SecD
VLRDHASLFADEIANPQQSTDVSGSPDVSFDFTSAGATVFHAVTAGLAHRGALVSGFGQTLDQHFAIAIDGELLSVPSIDYRTYPDGIQGANRADISGGFTVRSAQALASLIRLGPMPVALVLVAESSG